MENLHFELTIDGIPYDVNAQPYSYNDATRFYVGYNGGETYVFAWDSDLRRLSAIGDGTAGIPEELEEAISVKLQQLAATRLPQLS